MALPVFRLPSPPEEVNIIKDKKMLGYVKRPFWWGAMPETTKPVLAPVSVADKVLRCLNMYFGKDAPKGRYITGQMMLPFATILVFYAYLNIKQKIVASRPKVPKMKGQKKYHWPQIPDFLITTTNKIHALLFVERLGKASMEKK